MAHDDGLAPVPMFSARRVCAVVSRSALAMVLLCLAGPLFGQRQSDPGVATQNVLTKCQRIFLTCAQTCVADTCRLCEEARELCKAEMYSNTGVPTPRLPAGWPTAGGLIIFTPPIPGGLDWTNPRPYPSPFPTRPPSVPVPPPSGQTAEHCNPEKFDDILQRYREQSGVPSTGDLLNDIGNGIDRMDAEIDELKKTASDSEAELEAAELTRDFLRGAAKLIEEMERSGASSDPAMIALKLTIARALDSTRGLTGRGAVAGLSVALFGSDAALIRDTAPSYHDKQNALGHILARYGRDEGLWGIDDDDSLAELLDLANTTARESLIAACRSEGMTSPRDSGGGGGRSDDLDECKNAILEAGQCCTSAGIGTISGTAIDVCPPENRTPKPKPYAPLRDGCGTAVTDFFLGDLPDNPNFRVGPIDTSYYGPSFYPACDFHDDCWGTCHTLESGMTQDVCDAEFGSRLKQICDSANLGWFNRMTCRKNAWIFQRLVAAGEAVLGAYRNGQRDGCDCCEGGAS